MFIRDKLTWLGYLLIGYNCFITASFGPIMPFLRAELELDYAVAALHFSAFALGGLTVGLVGDKLMRWFGTPRTLWGGAFGILLGVIFLLTARSAVATVGGALIIGASGSLMGQTITSIMSNRFGVQRVIGITEANIIAAIFCALAPLTVGLIAKSGLDWRFALILPVVLLAYLTLTNLKTVTVGTAVIQHAPPQSTLPPAYWAYFAVIAFSVAAEWSLVFWSSDFIENVVHLSKADAAIAVSVFTTSMFVGRLIGSRITHLLPPERLLPIAALLAAVGFLVFWLGRSAPVNLFGLMLVGLGEANMYPMAFSAAIGTAPEQSARAASRMSISTGGAIISAPMILGLIAKQSGIFTAYAFVAVILILAAIGIFIANAMNKRHNELRANSL